MKKNTRPICYKCNVPMKIGKALENGFTGSPDFLGDQSGVKTISADPKKVKMIDCWKCPECGHSIKA
jgi:hypothetical protein